MKRTLIARLLILAALLLAVLAYRQCQQHRQDHAGQQQTEHSTPSTQPGKTNRPDDSKPSTSKNHTNVPAHVLKVLDYVEKKGEAPDGYVGGRTFQNREHRLEEKDPKGRAIRYREWDVYPKIDGKNRGAERLITGSDQSAWYTRDHYRTFVEVKKE
jgi:ribonuclease T1